jgi:hypothetical protein
LRRNFVGADGGKRAARSKVPEKSKLLNSQPVSFVLGFCTSVDVRFIPFAVIARVAVSVSVLAVVSGGR